VADGFYAYILVDQRLQKDYVSPSQFRTDIISAYEQVGTYRGAADLAGTTPKR